jgi:thymidylate synthase
MRNYLDLLNKILTDGVDSEDRTGVGTRSLVGEQLRFDLSAGFPAVTTKKLIWGAVKAELLWFIEGSGDERRLAEIQFGTRDAEKKTIWTANANADYWRPKAEFEGDLGRVYGVQWRNWRTPVIEGSSEHTTHDQLKSLIENIKNDPFSRRHVLSAWNPGELDKMALPPCHMMAQFYVRNSKLSCQMYQRSCDAALGLPFNIASYALLTHLIAQECDLGLGELIITLGDVHIYNNHFDGVKEQLTRAPLDLPTLWLNPTVKRVTEFKMEDIALWEYHHCGPIKMQMAV